MLALALAGFNVMALLFPGTVLSAVIGGALGKFAFFDVMDLLGKGTLGPRGSDPRAFDFRRRSIPSS